MVEHELRILWQTWSMATLTCTSEIGLCGWGGNESSLRNFYSFQGGQEVIGILDLKSYRKCLNLALELRVPLLNSCILRYQSPSKWCPWISSLGRCACRTCRSGSWMDGEVFNGRYLEASLHCAFTFLGYFLLIDLGERCSIWRPIKPKKRQAACFFLLGKSFLVLFLFCWEKHWNEILGKEGLTLKKAFFLSYKTLLPCGKLTWNPKMEVWKMFFLFKRVIFRFHC